MHTKEQTNHSQQTLKSVADTAESPSSPTDPKTLYAAAIVLKRQELEHTARQYDTKISLEGRKAHRFVAINLNFMINTILMLGGVTHEEAVAQNLAIHKMIVKDIEKQAMKKAPVS